MSGRSELNRSSKVGNTELIHRKYSRHLVHLGLSVNHSLGRATRDSSIDPRSPAGVPAALYESRTIHSELGAGTSNDSASLGQMDTPAARDCRGSIPVHSFTAPSLSDREGGTARRTGSEGNGFNAARAALLTLSWQLLPDVRTAYGKLGVARNA